MAANKSIIYRLFNVSGIVLASLLVLASFAVYISPRFGWRVDGLRSGSMAPVLNTGDMVVTRPVSPEAVEVGDIIIFRSVDKRDNLISHRVVSIEINSPLSFRTKGDANENPDPFVVPAGNLVGELAFHAPLLGYAVLGLQTPLGLMASLVIPGVVILAACLKSLRDELAKRARIRG
ncbi:MAG: signal peptidase I [Dehalococcoidales bacterium]|nr:signal peptidase I [Dehalococcoidales bacterium]